MIRRKTNAILIIEKLNDSLFVFLETNSVKFVMIVSMKIMKHNLVEVNNIFVIYENENDDNKDDDDYYDADN